MTILAHLRILARASIQDLANRDESRAPWGGALGTGNRPPVWTGTRRASVPVWPYPDGLGAVGGVVDRVRTAEAIRTPARTPSRPDA